MLGESIELDFIRYLRSQNFYAMSDAEAYEYFDILYCYDMRETQDEFYYKNTNLNAWLKDILNQESRYKTDYVKARYLDNHDRERVAKYKQGNDYINVLALNFYLKGTSFIYAGDEVCDVHQPSLFEIDEVIWDYKKDVSYVIKRLSNIKRKSIYELGSFDVNFQEKNIAYLTYKYNENRSLGIFNFESAEENIKVNLKDGKYINLFNDEIIAITNGIIKVNNTPIIIEYSDKNEY